MKRLLTVLAGLALAFAGILAFAPQAAASDDGQRCYNPYVYGFGANGWWSIPDGYACQGGGEVVSSTFTRYHNAAASSLYGCMHVERNVTWISDGWQEQTVSCNPGNWSGVYVVNYDPPCGDGRDDTVSFRWRWTASGGVNVVRATVTRNPADCL